MVSKKLYKIAYGRPKISGNFGITDGFMTFLAVSKKDAKKQFKIKYPRKIIVR